jgi:hypothetical protein
LRIRPCIRRTGPRLLRAAGAVTQSARKEKKRVEGAEQARDGSSIARFQVTTMSVESAERQLSVS